MIAVIQPHIPFYRNDFFLSLADPQNMDIFTYSNYKSKSIQLKGAEGLPTIPIKSYKIGPFIIFNPFQFLRSKYEVVVLPFNMILLPIWIALIFNRLFLRKKYIIWGHGISIPNYLQEIKKPHPLKKILVRLSCAVWVYTDEEKKYWQQHFPDKEIVSLGNSVTIGHNPSDTERRKLKEKYNILQPTIIIYCARFNNAYRRTDLLIEAMEKLDASKFAFIVIGDGPEKPNFSRFKNVYDFGSVFENELKSDLFQISDLYFQPGWVGLSIVEALKRGLPIFTFKRSSSIFQCVEYAYLQDGYNAYLFEDVSSFVQRLAKLTPLDYKTLASNAVVSAENLTVENMVIQAKSTL